MSRVIDPSVLSHFDHVNGHVMTIYRHFNVIFNFAFSIFIFKFFCFVNHRNCNKMVLFCTFCSLSRFPTIDHSEPFLSIHDYHVTNPNCSKSISFKTKSPNQKNYFKSIYVYSINQYRT